MGLGFGYRSGGGSCVTPSCHHVVEVERLVKVKLPNPDPRNWSIIKTKRVGKNLVVLVRYPDCTNYEGKKVLLFRRMTREELREVAELDPHFSKENLKLVARFAPTLRGWDLATITARSL